MRRSHLSILPAAALSVALLSGGAGLAQGLDETTATGLSVLGVQAPVEALSTDQVARIQNVLGSTDDDTTKRERIELILAETEADPMPGYSVAQLRDSVTADLAGLGFATDDIGYLTLDQMGQIENVVGSGEPRDAQVSRIEQILGNEATATGRIGVAAMQDRVATDLAGLGFSTDGIEMLTLGQLNQIEAVSLSSADDGEKKARIGKIIGE